MQVDSKSKECPICGFEFPAPLKLKWIALLLLIIMIVALIYRLL